MARPGTRLEWAWGGAASITEPAAAKKELGWTALEPPPAAYMNWIQNTVEEWFDFLIDDFIDTTYATEHYTDEDGANAGKHKDINALSLTLTGGGDIVTNGDISTTSGALNCTGAATADGFEYTAAGDGVRKFQAVLASENYRFPDTDPGLIAAPPTSHGGLFEISDSVSLRTNDSAMFVFEVGPNSDIESFVIQGQTNSVLGFVQGGDFDAVIWVYDTNTSRFVSTGATKNKGITIPIGPDQFSHEVSFDDSSPNYTGSGYNVGSNHRIVGIQIINNFADQSGSEGLYITDTILKTRHASVESSVHGKRV